MSPILTDLLKMVVKKTGFIRVINDKTARRAHFVKIYDQTKGDDQYIGINIDKIENDAEIVKSIIFELYNAYYFEEFTKTSYLCKINNMSKHEYIKQNELIEYNNLKYANDIFDKYNIYNIANTNATSNVFYLLQPYIINDFDQFLDTEIKSGHSNLFAMEYNRIMK